MRRFFLGIFDAAGRSRCGAIDFIGPLASREIHAISVSLVGPFLQGHLDRVRVFAVVDGGGQLCLDRGKPKSNGGRATQYHLRDDG